MKAHRKICWAMFSGMKLFWRQMCTNIILPVSPLHSLLWAMSRWEAEEKKSLTCILEILLICSLYEERLNNLLWKMHVTFILRNFGREAVSDWDRVPGVVEDFSTSKVPDFHPGKISNITHLQLAETLINSIFGFNPVCICQNSTSCHHHHARWKAWGHHSWCEVWGQAQAVETSDDLAQNLLFSFDAFCSSPQASFHWEIAISVLMAANVSS